MTRWFGKEKGMLPHNYFPWKELRLYIKKEEDKWWNSSIALYSKSPDPLTSSIPIDQYYMEQKFGLKQNIRDIQRYRNEILEESFEGITNGMSKEYNNKKIMNAQKDIIQEIEGDVTILKEYI